MQIEIEIEKKMIFLRSYRNDITVIGSVPKNSKNNVSVSESEQPLSNLSSLTHSRSLAARGPRLSEHW